jgi:hypothetical protein
MRGYLLFKKGVYFLNKEEGIKSSTTPSLSTLGGFT